MLLPILTLIMVRWIKTRPRIGMDSSIIAYQGAAHCGLAIRIQPILVLVLTPMVIVYLLRLAAVPVGLLALLVVGREQRPSFSGTMPSGTSPFPPGVYSMAAQPVPPPEAV